MQATREFAAARLRRDGVRAAAMAADIKAGAGGAPRERAAINAPTGPLPISSSSR
jgi:hypothetical protein